MVRVSIERDRSGNGWFGLRSGERGRRSTSITSLVSRHSGVCRADYDICRAIVLWSVLWSAIMVSDLVLGILRAYTQ